MEYGKECEVQWRKRIVHATSHNLFEILALIVLIWVKRENNLIYFSFSQFPSIYTRFFQNTSTFYFNLYSLIWHTIEKLSLFVE